LTLPTCFVTKVVELFTWPIVVLVIAMFFLVLFRKPIASKISTMGRVEARIKQAEAIIEFNEVKSDRSVPRPGGHVLTREQIVQQMRTAPFLKPEDVEQHAEQALKYFLRNGIITDQQLHELLTSDKVITTLRNLYVHELSRSEDKPLDPIAIATFGSLLFVLGVRDEVITVIRDQIRKSDEYRKK
jgi:hypothetical protein